jgi:hypothetical protein
MLFGSTLSALFLVPAAMCNLTVSATIFHGLQAEHPFSLASVSSALQQLAHDGVLPSIIYLLFSGNVPPMSIIDS